LWSGAALHISVVGSAEDEPDAGDTALGQAALHRSVVDSAEDEPDAGDAALGQAALHRPVVSSAEEKDDPEAGNAALGRAALHRPVIEVGGKNAHHSAALPRPWTPDSDTEIEDLLRCTPEPRTPPVCSPDRTLFPGAARITVEAANEPAVNVEAFFWKIASCRHRTSSYPQPQDRGWQRTIEDC